jgi:hypothetical protein
VKAGGA